MKSSPNQRQGDSSPLCLLWQSVFTAVHQVEKTEQWPETKVKGTDLCKQQQQKVSLITALLTLQFVSFVV